MPAIEIRGLRVVRGGATVLEDLSLDVAEGSVTGLLGPSGCGKSTLMRSVVGVQRVAGGTVSVMGMPAGTRALRHRVGYMTQSPSVYPDLTVRENVVYFARVLGAPREDVDRAIAAVDLTSHADRPVARTSGGQTTRASLAVALLGDPPLLVLDEPTVGLDPVLRRDLWRTFRALADRGTTILVSSHVMDEAAHCDMLVLMREGAVVATDTPAALRERTGTDDLGEAFLRLVEREGVAA